MQSQQRDFNDGAVPESLQTHLTPKRPRRSDRRKTIAMHDFTVTLTTQNELRSQ